jgi:hypothetical protein
MYDEFLIFFLSFPIFSRWVMKLNLSKILLEYLSIHPIVVHEENKMYAYRSSLDSSCSSVVL